MVNISWILAPPFIVKPSKVLPQALWLWMTSATKQVQVTYLVATTKRRRNNVATIKVGQLPTSKACFIVNFIVSRPISNYLLSAWHTEMPLPAISHVLLLVAVSLFATHVLFSLCKVVHNNSNIGRLVSIILFLFECRPTLIRIVPLFWVEVHHMHVTFLFDNP